MSLLRGETELSGSWIFKDGSIVADPISEKISALVSDLLEKVSDSEDGWSTLYIDPTDGRYWELSHPENDSHGGGAPKLLMLMKEQASQKYVVTSDG